MFVCQNKRPLYREGTFEYIKLETERERSAKWGESDCVDTPFLSSSQNKMPYSSMMMDPPLIICYGHLAKKSFLFSFFVGKFFFTKNDDCFLFCLKNIYISSTDIVIRLLMTVQAVCSMLNQQRMVYLFKIKNKKNPLEII